MLVSEERRGVNGFGSASEEFMTLVELLELQDLSLSGSNLTFFEGGSGCARSKLDRFLIKDDYVGWSDMVV